jgi:hypothetical protein
MPLAAQVEVEYSGTGGASTMRLRLRNCTNQQARHQVWAGEVHACTRPGHQPLITGADGVIILAPRETRDHQIPVYCGNSNLAAPADGVAYHPPSRVHPRLRTILLSSRHLSPDQIQMLIWAETDEHRLPESGPRRLRDVPVGGRQAAGGPYVLSLMGRDNVLVDRPPPAPRTPAEQRAAQQRALGGILAFLLIPTPVVIILLLTCRSARSSGPRRSRRC